MARTLPIARDQFVAAIARDTHAVEQPRLVAVLDALIAWSNKHPTLLKFREEEDTPGTIAFERVGSKMIVWAASPRRQDVPRLELVPNRFFCFEECCRTGRDPDGCRAGHRPRLNLRRAPSSMVLALALDVRREVPDGRGVHGDTLPRALRSRTRSTVPCLF